MKIINSTGVCLVGQAVRLSAVYQSLNTIENYRFRVMDRIALACFRSRRTAVGNHGNLHLMRQTYDLHDSVILTLD